MGKEVLAVPEEKLYEVITVIRAGLEYVEKRGLTYCDVSDETLNVLKVWCDDEEEYMKNIGDMGARS